METQNKEEVLKQLEEISKELNVDLYNEEVIFEWHRRNGGMDGKIADEIHPLYRNSDDESYYGVRLNKENKIIAV